MNKLLLLTTILLIMTSTACQENENISVSDSYEYETSIIDNIKNHELSDIKSYPVNLHFWGNVNITTGYIEAHHPYAVAYLTDEDNNILYQFTGIINGYKIKNVLTEDVNNDGLEDIKIILDHSSENLAYIFIQTEDGLFYDSKLDPNPDIAGLISLP
ncbi:MAG: hypothetical protein K2G63_03035 [Oscillospiraceae bacterium]|nr:hypothetical protein [Oscillospiraceae bacterium]